VKMISRGCAPINSATCARAVSITPLSLEYISSSIKDKQQPGDSPLVAESPQLKLPALLVSLEIQVSLSSFGEEGWGEEAVTPGGNCCPCLPQRLCPPALRWRGEGDPRGGCAKRSRPMH
jgi:hypothetical protein